MGENETLSSGRVTLRKRRRIKEALSWTGRRILSMSVARLRQWLPVNTGNVTTVGLGRGARGHNSTIQHSTARTSMGRAAEH